ncbi:MAG: 3-deoxy-7-phosphoheptulonate synthase class II [Sandaracinaceae bacterium]
MTSPSPVSARAAGWSPTSWRERANAQPLPYPDDDALRAAVDKLGALPPLVTSWEIQRLKGYLAEAQEGRRFVLQGGDCAETLEDCRPDVITRKLKMLLQMSLVLVHGGQRPVVRIGRFAGQYAKPRSRPTEVGEEQGEPVELPSYFGDLINRLPFTAKDRTADPSLLLTAYQHAALTLNFLRSLTAGGFADLHHPEYWDLSFLTNADLDADLRREYVQTSERLAEALRFMEALGETGVEELTRVEIFTSHEGLNLLYESAQTRAVPRRAGYWDLTGHLLWIGDRTRQLDGAHVEFFRGVENPVGVKIGPSLEPVEIEPLLARLNPADEAGKIVLITRLGAGRAADLLPPLVEAVRAAGRRVLWVVDPMHGNTQVTDSGLKTRSFDDIQREVEVSMDVHRAAGTVFGGVHFELTGDDVTECVGGAIGLREHDLGLRYGTACDPRLNYRQALEMAFSIARRLRADRRDAGAGQRGPRP